MSPASLRGLHPRDLHPSAPWAFNLSVVDLLVAFPAANLPSLEFGQQSTYYPRGGREPCFPMTYLGEDITNEIHREISRMVKGKIQVLWTSSCLPSTHENMMPGAAAANTWPEGHKLADGSHCAEERDDSECKEPGPLETSPAAYTLGRTCSSLKWIIKVCRAETTVIYGFCFLLTDA